MSLSFSGLRRFVLTLVPAVSFTLSGCQADNLKALYISGAAMQPTLAVGDRVWVDKASYRSSDPRRGDIIAFRSSVQSLGDAIFTQRVVALPGEEVSVRNGKVLINGVPLDEPYINDPPRYVFGPVRVPADQYFALGDSRNNSYDSHFGQFVLKDRILGRVTYRFWPLAGIGEL